MVSSTKDVRVFVHLGHGFGAESWRRRQALGLIPGLNDYLAYGYYRAGGNGWSIRYSEDKREDRLSKLFRIALRKLLGFDLIHAWRNRKWLLSADIVWTHTELDSLAVLALCFIRPRHSRPKMIANCVWLFDRWNDLSRPRRAIYRKLLEHADIVTTFSPSNLQVAKDVLSGVRCEYVAWGAAGEGLTRSEERTVHRPLRIVSLGSDMHRDWETLLRAFAGDERYVVRIAARRVSRRMIRGLSNVALFNPRTADEVKALYEWADVVVVSLKPNLHASGITVILEAVILGVPVVCTRSGGLCAYFSSREVRYVPALAPVAMRRAVEELAADKRRRAEMVARAQHRLAAAELTAQGFAERQRRLSEKLV